MLLSLTIRNIALIEDLTIALHRGFHVLTGETGAGKSILVDAVNLVLGGRADRELIRTGCDKAFVEALFDISENAKVKEYLSQQELEAEDGMLSISREIMASGRNICRVMGMVMPLAVLKDITSTLVDVHGQHEHQFLMDEQKHLYFLDSFGDDAHRQRIDAADAAFQAFREAEKELNRLIKENSQREQRMDMLRFQINELKVAKLKAGEEEVLRRDIERLRHSVKISTALRRAYDSVYAGAGKQLSAVALVKDAVSALDPISALDPEYESMRNKLKDMYFELEDCGLQLRNLSEDSQADPERSDQLEARLDLIKRLERKYGPTVEDIIAYSEKINQEFNSFQHMDDTIEEMKENQKRLRLIYRKEAEALTLSRKELSIWFEKEMEEQLAQLGMGKTRFSVHFQPASASSSLSTDEVAFLIAPNPGEPLKPLAKIASGGELSRLMLAIKSIAAQKGLVSTMIFDEIDTGISGRMAQVVAEKMAKISAYRQVLCVTHLPQIAAMADYHFLVEKEVQDEKTHTNIIEMNKEMRESELARMVGGSDLDSDSGLIHARSMLKAASELKCSFF